METMTLIIRKLTGKEKKTVPLKNSNWEIVDFLFCMAGRLLMKGERVIAVEALNHASKLSFDLLTPEEKRNVLA